MIVVDVAAYFAVTSTAALNWLAAVVGFLQYVQPWTLYITATYVHRLLLDERHRVPPGRRVRCPLAQLVAMIVVGTVYFTLYVPPVRLMMYRSIASYSALCTVPLFDQWQLSVGQTASTDPVYYVCYDCLYTLVVYLAPIFPLFYRYRRLVDAVFRRDYQSVVVRSGTALGSWTDVVSVMCGVHIITQCTKSTLLAMRLGEAVATDKYMAAADDVFQLLNVIANVLVVVRPLCHLPVMVVYDRRLRASALRAHATLAAAVLSRLKREESDYSFDDVELDSIVAEDRQVLDDVDHLDDAVHV